MEKLYNVFVGNDIDFENQLPIRRCAKIVIAGETTTFDHECPACWRITETPKTLTECVNAINHEATITTSHPTPPYQRDDAGLSFWIGVHNIGFECFDKFIRNQSLIERISRDTSNEAVVDIAFETDIAMWRRGVGFLGTLEWLLNYRDSLAFSIDNDPIIDIDDFDFDFATNNIGNNIVYSTAIY